MVATQNANRVPTLDDLLAYTRATYELAIARQLSEIGCDDVPPKGIFLLRSLARSGARATAACQELGLSGREGTMLAKALAATGYLVVGKDGLHLATISPRGLLAARASIEAMVVMDALLAPRHASGDRVRFRAKLTALLTGGR